MRFLGRLVPRSITTQISWIVAASVLFGTILVMTVLQFAYDGGPARHPTALAARIAVMLELLRASDRADEGALLVAARRAGIQVTQIAIADLAAPSPGFRLPMAAEFVARRLQGWRIDVLDVRHSLTPGVDRLTVRRDDRTAWLFDVPTDRTFLTIALMPTFGALTVVLIFVVFLSIYAVRWITSPLSALAAATQSFGRSPDEELVVRRRGPQEISRVADALNEMRTRIRALLEDRTRMLAAISHDLRTPLTRLRLRAEKVDAPELRDGLLYEITRIAHMLDETLNYLRQDVRTEGMTRIDLPSLLQTVCAEFADVGHAVGYEGPAKLTCTCRPGILARAISNVVDNAVKHGSIVTIRLRVRDRTAEIDVADDGPGIPASLQAKVFEPFFKGDSARASAGSGGFGLGLSIARNAVTAHGGAMELLDRAPRGLIVRMSLPSDGIAARPQAIGGNNS